MHERGTTQGVCTPNGHNVKMVLFLMNGVINHSGHQRHEVVILLDRRIAVTMQSPIQFSGDAAINAYQNNKSR